ncbi:mediator of RNA polymerase II transcription subunit 27-like [Clavelina lepadiformis]|uniref:Mediator of RNA polymerase II transcription subunit 27 n=1 Tax=Clavelina lepadiformis TaxID=159417 RepID=A0ABP0GM38_CLALP
MADLLSQAKTNITLLTQAISCTQKLRSTVTNVFNFLCEGVKPDEDQDNKLEEAEIGSLSKDARKFLQRFQDYLQAVNQDYNEVEKCCNAMQSTTELPLLGPLGLLAVDPTFDKNYFYRDVLVAYQWNQKMHDYAQSSFNFMQSNETKKSIFPGGKRRVRAMPQRFQIVNPQLIHLALSSVQNQVKENVVLKIISSAGETRVIQATVAKVFVATILLHNSVMEKVIVRALSEESFQEAGSYDIVRDSQFECMRRITDHAMAAILEYSTLHQASPELALKYILLWLSSYKTLFIEKCSVCRKHLRDGLPPLWRDFRNPIACHDFCRA